MTENNKSVLPIYVLTLLDHARGLSYVNNPYDFIDYVFELEYYNTEFEEVGKLTRQWFKNKPSNIKLAIEEFDNEPELHVKLKGLVTGAAYLNYNVPFQTFSTNSLSSPAHMNTNFTKSWLAKNWSEYEAYNNAGLLEFEEVEN
ncbi:hypothetical protein EFN43_09245 [Pediococcus pentosaceus]|uniref:hypothetical protein n=1 Tax=Pediococcus pentosaceus TaxID=1255 RepID=UPI0021A5F8BD|nr:hypothetical protein [Pediococcus pentosaceus]MCT3021243.1 hypothetical protein [Pediococcus pentosaceus]